MFAFLRYRRFHRPPKPAVSKMLLMALLASICALSCSTKEPSHEILSSKGTGADEPSPAATPEDQLYEQLRSGMFQMGAAAGSIEEALAAAKEALPKLSGNLKGAMADAIEVIDSAGAEVSEFADDPPPASEVAKAFSVWDDRRLKAVEAGNDAVHDLREASGILADVDESNPGPPGKAAREVRALILVALDDLWGAIEAFGGKPEPEGSPITP